MPTDPLVDSPSPEPRPEPQRWPWWQLFAFRYALMHYALYSFPGPIGAMVQTVTGGLALAGIDISKAPWSWLGAPLGWVDAGWQWLTTRMDAHGLAPYEVIHQSTGSGDTGAAYAQLLFIVVVSLAGASIWCRVSRARAHPQLGRWLHLIVRFDLAFTLFGYGFAKFYGGQFGEMSLNRLTQEIGDTWPMTMVGTFMQASKPYELFGGACEVLGGLLLLPRRTTLLGACISIGTLTNICALNWLYGVPVKQYSAHLLLYAVGLLAPFLPQLSAVFVRNRPSFPVDLRVVRGKLAGRVLLGLGSAWLAAYLVETHLHGVKPRPWLEGHERPALYGLWTVETMALDGHEVPMTDASRWRDFAIDRAPTAWARELTGKRHYFEFAWDEAGGIAQVKERGASGDAAPWTCECGVKVVKGDAPLLLRIEDRGKPVDVERRSLVLKGRWDGHDLELHTVEKRFRLQTGFRLRQELPDFW
jgi:uncharacterized membrane protein YphA (DoxX/SURF4 family)